MFKSMIFITLFASLSLTGGCSVGQTKQAADFKCTEPRPEICTMDYTPVCGIHTDGSSKTYSNACSACSNKEVVGYNKDVCPQDMGQ